MKLFINFLFVVVSGAFVYAQDKEELERKKQATLEELQMAQELLDETRKRRKSTSHQVALLNRGINSTERLITTIQQEINMLDEEILTTQQDIHEIESSIDQGKEEYAKILYSIFKHHTEEEKLMYLLASEDINEFYQRIKYMKYLKDYRERKIEELNNLIKDLEERKAKQLRIMNQKTVLLIEKEKENSTLLTKRDQRNGIIRKLARDEDRLRKQIKEKERIRKELEEAIKRKIEEEAERRASTTLFASLTPEQKLLGNSFLQNKGRLPWPVQRGVITSEFGLVNHPVLAGVKINNNGIDISTTPGAGARAIYDGEVTSVFAILGANYAVMVMHGEYISVYQNLIDVKVKPGDKVIAKQELGKVHTDEEEGVAVLHLQLWKSKQILDPNLWLSK